MPVTRHENLQRIERDGAFDVVVVGGGVNGIGVYRDLALQGLRVLLVERRDFASGCSAAPSRMIHGGLRYLENGEFDLVRESLRERDLLLQNAPHMVRPMPTLIPITTVFSGLLNGAASFFGWSGKPSTRGAVPIKAGLSLYDWVTRKRRVLPRHRFNSRRATRRVWPALPPEVRSSAVYYDAWISHPERLCLEMIGDVARARPDCIALNYVELSMDGDTPALRCQRSGRTLAVTASVIVNATGAWLDSTARALGGAPQEQMVSGTKGSHLVIDNPDLAAALNGHMVYFENADGRVCIVFPYLGKVLAGSTDIRVRAPARVRCEPDEQAYIIASLRLVFPDIAITPAQVVFSFSGIRPLPVSDHDFTGRISRGHYITRLDGAVPQFCMVGGKWTTFRAFAEQTADAVLAELGQARKASTESWTIGGGRDFQPDPEAFAAQHGVTPTRAAHLLDHYGSRAAEVLDFCHSQPDDAPLVAGCTVTTAEVDWLIETEWVETLCDLVLRRTSLAITGEITTDIIARLADRLAHARALTDAARRAEIETLTDTLSQFYGVSRETLTQRTTKWRDQCA
ncbi:glycerol-3-phosphate dehydrogenase/oxidase [Thalassorhabdomicrobium marinisediminis]|uniref:glycerol-3-phosphate dehydrogenase/oxidase n=1 Tax=Thalassorhabdomicrobium marinisediminis TaxID=2170577 RepID=UPI002492571A|nr:glycerol-3-phosphate dehydrogenase/oxidase [Thalassorhabdomicrobium marinisediminis]